jgi:hypothetical protein
MPIIELASWQLGCAMFDGDLAAGPIPVLFSEDAVSTVENIRKNVQKAHHDYQRAAKSLYDARAGRPGGSSTADEKTQVKNKLNYLL